MSYVLIFLLLFSIHSQEIPEKWTLDQILNFVNEDISKRNYTSSGVIDPHHYIKNDTLKQFQDYLETLHKQYGLCVYFTLIKQFDTNNDIDKFLNETSLELFHHFEKSKFDINPDQIISVIYSVDDKKYKVELGQFYNEEEGNIKSLADIFEDNEQYLENKKVFVILATVAFKVETFRHPSPEKGKKKNEEKTNPKKKEEKKKPEKKVKLNDSKNIFSLYLILIVIVILFIMVSFLILRLSKRLKRLKLLDEKSIDYNSMNNLNE